MGATFPLQHRVEPFFQGMQVQNVARGVGEGSERPNTYTIRKV